MSRRTDIVVTTIFEPAWLAGYLDNLRRYGHAADTTLRIIVDRKTPASVAAAAEQARRDGFRIDCPTLDEQVEYLRKLGAADDLIPWNTDNRRNIGFLRAWHDGADVLISIDDDNYCLPDGDFVGGHHVVGRPSGDEPQLRLADGAPWFNLCSMLDASVAEPIYPRGFPYAARAPARLAQPGPAPHDERARTVAINAGLWIDDPDVDAITRLALRPRVRAAHDRAVLLGRATWSPVNTQNTALMRAIVPAYYYVRMGYALQGMKIDRFGDILSGYFAQACAKHLGWAVRIGAPVARHTRTPHDLLVDLYHELAGIALVEDLLPWLQALELSGTDAASTYRSLSLALDEQAGRFKGLVWDQGGREFLRETARNMRAWLDLLKGA